MRGKDMSDPRFDIIFRGDIVFGHQIADVKKRLMQLFKADAAKVDALFSGAALPLKRNLDQAAAEKYQAVLLKAGAQVDVCTAGSVKTVATRAVKPASQPKKISDSNPRAIPPGRSQTLKERLAAAGLAEKETLVERKQTQQPLQTADASDASGLTLAPAGTEVLKPEERSRVEAVTVDTGGLSIRAMEGELLDVSERPAPVSISLDLGNLDLAAVGEDLLRADEKLPLPEVAVDVSDLELAPVGSDLGQVAGTIPPPPPDTSDLSLSE